MRSEKIDMINNKISSRYAASLMDLADENNKLEAMYDDVKTIISALDGSSQLKRLLVNPIIKPKLKLIILDEIFGSKVSSETQKFLRFIVEKNREEYLYSIMQSFLELRNKRLGVIEVQVRTAVNFNDKQISELRDKFEYLLNKKVDLTFIIDKNVLGGFVAKVGDTLYDASIRTQLNNLKRQFLQGNTL